MAYTERNTYIVYTIIELKLVGSKISDLVNIVMILQVLNPKQAYLSVTF